MGVTAGIFLASILLKEMRYLVYIRYLWGSVNNIKESFGLLGIQLPEKYKENFDVSSEGAFRKLVAGPPSDYR